MMFTVHPLTVGHALFRAFHTQQTTSHHVLGAGKVAQQLQFQELPSPALPASLAFLSNNFLLVLQALRPHLSCCGRNEPPVPLGESASVSVGWFLFPVPSLKDPQPHLDTQDPALASAELS